MSLSAGSVAADLSLTQPQQLQAQISERERQSCLSATCCPAQHLGCITEAPFAGRRLFHHDCICNNTFLETRGFLFFDPKKKLIKPAVDCCMPPWIHQLQLSYSSSVYFGWNYFEKQTCSLSKSFRGYWCFHWYWIYFSDTYNMKKIKVKVVINEAFRQNNRFIFSFLKMMQNWTALEF